MMAANKLKLYVRSLNCDDVVDKLNETRYSDISDIIRSLHISGADLIELNELNVRLKYGNKIEKKKLQRLQMLVYEIQTAPDQIFPNDSSVIRVPSGFKTSAMNTMTINNAKQCGDALLEELRNKSQIRVKGDDVHDEIAEYQNQMPDQRAPSCNSRKCKPDIKAKPLISLHENLNQNVPHINPGKCKPDDHFANHTRNSRVSFMKSESTSKVYEEDQFEFCETVEYENTEELQKEEAFAQFPQSRPSSSMEYITLMDSDDQPVYEEIGSEQAQSNTQITQPPKFCEWNIAATEEIKQKGPTPPSLPQRDRNQGPKQRILRTRLSRKNGSHLPSTLSNQNENTMEADMKLQGPENNENNFYEVPVALKSPLSNLQQHEFFRDITRMQGIDILQNAPIGTYLLRKSANKSFFAVLMIKGPKKILNIPTAFEAITNAYWLETQDATAPQKFQSLSDMLTYYTNNQLNGCKLLPGASNTII